jgi:hypothetical protein
MATWHDVRRFALALPGTSEEVSRGTSAWVVSKKGFVWERLLRKSDIAALGSSAPAGPILAVRTADLEMKEVLLASNPGVFFTTPHFNGYPAVLVRLDKIKPAELKNVIVEAWLTRASPKVAAAFLQEPKARSAAARRART